VVRDSLGSDNWRSRCDRANCQYMRTPLKVDSINDILIRISLLHMQELRISSSTIRYFRIVDSNGYVDSSYGVDSIHLHPYIQYL